MNISKFFLSIISFGVVLGICSCGCNQDSYDCPNINDQSWEIYGSLQGQNQKFINNSGDTISLNVSESNVEQQESGFCKSVIGSCSCSPCNSHKDLEIKTEGNSIGGFTQNVFTRFEDGDIEFESNEFTLRFMDMTFSGEYPLAEGENVLVQGDRILNDKSYSEVYQLYGEPNGYILISPKEGILGFRIPATGETYLRL